MEGLVLLWLWTHNGPPGQTVTITLAHVTQAQCLAIVAEFKEAEHYMMGLLRDDPISALKISRTDARCFSRDGRVIAGSGGKFAKQLSDSLKQQGK